MASIPVEPIDYKTLTVLERGEIIYAMKQENVSNAEIRRRLSISDDQERLVRSWARQWAEANEMPFPIQKNDHARWDEDNSYLQVLEPDPQEVTDQQSLEQALINLGEEKERYCVMIRPDAHIPYEHGKALNVYFDFLNRLQPDIIIDGNDVLDGPNLGTYPVTAKQKAVDALSVTLQRYTQLREIERNITSGDTTDVWIMGNHDWRYFNWARMNAPEVAETIEALVLKTIRDTGSLFLGQTCDAVAFDQLLVLHGVHHGEDAAKKMYKDLGNQYLVSVMGHVHKTQVYTRTINRFDAGRVVKVTKEAHSLGSLSGLVPFYAKSNARAYNWNLGFGYGFVNPHDHTVEFHNIYIDHNTYQTREMMAA